MDRGFVLVDEFCRTNVPDVYAVGDLIPTLQLAHVGFAEGILVAEQLGRPDPRPIDYDGVPADHLLRARGRLRRHHRGQGQGALRRRQGRRSTYDLAGNGKCRSSRPPAR